MRPGTSWDPATEESQPPHQNLITELVEVECQLQKRNKVFPFNLETLTHTEVVTTYTVKTTVCVLDGNSPYIATRQIHFCTSENVLDRSGHVWILGFPRLVTKHM